MEMIKLEFPDLNQWFEAPSMEAHSLEATKNKRFCGERRGRKEVGGGEEPDAAEILERRGRERSGLISQLMICKSGYNCSWNGLAGSCLGDDVCGFVRQMLGLDDISFTPSPSKLYSPLSSPGKIHSPDSSRILSPYSISPQSMNSSFGRSSPETEYQTLSFSGQRASMVCPRSLENDPQGINSNSRSIIYLRPLERGHYSNCISLNSNSSSISLHKSCNSINLHSNSRSINLDNTTTTTSSIYQHSRPTLLSYMKQEETVTSTSYPPQSRPVSYQHISSTGFYQREAQVKSPPLSCANSNKEGKDSGATSPSATFAPEVMTPTATFTPGASPPVTFPHGTTSPLLTVAPGATCPPGTFPHGGTSPPASSPHGTTSPPTPYYCPPNLSPPLPNTATAAQLSPTQFYAPGAQSQSYTSTTQSYSSMLQYYAPASQYYSSLSQAYTPLSQSYIPVSRIIVAPPTARPSSVPPANITFLTPVSQPALLRCSSQPTMVTASGAVMSTGGAVMTTGGHVMTAGGAVMASEGVVMTAGGPVMTAGGPVMTTGGPVMKMQRFMVVKRTAGGLVKLSETMKSLSAEQIELIKKMQPSDQVKCLQMQPVEEETKTVKSGGNKLPKPTREPLKVKLESRSVCNLPTPSPSPPSADGEKSPEGVHKCQDCGSSFRDSKQLLKHRRNHHQIYACKECGEQNVGYYKMASHSKRSHSKDPQYFCECGRNFSEKKGMTKHQNTCSVFKQSSAQTETKGFSMMSRI